MKRGEELTREALKVYNYRDLMSEQRPTGILINTIPGMINVDRNLIDPMLLFRNKYYTWNIFEQYFIHDCAKDDVPIHYAVEYVGNDYVIHKGCCDVNYSWYLKELVRNGILHPKYSSYLLVTVLENWFNEIPEERMWHILAHRLLTPYMKQYRMLKDKISFLTEVMNWDVYNIMRANNILKYNIPKDTFLEPKILDFALSKYKK